MEVKDVLEFLGIEGDIKDITGLKPAFEAKFTTVEALEKEKKNVGSFGFEVNDTAKKLFGLEKSEIKDLTTKEILALAKSKVDEKIKALEDAAGSGNDEKVLKLQSELEKVKGQATQYKTDLEKTALALDTEKANFEGKIKEFKVEGAIKSAKSKLSFIDNVKEIEKIGFDTMIGSKYKFDLDETGNAVVLDAKTNERVANPKKTGQYLGVEEVLTMELETVGLLKKNGLTGGNPAPRPNPAAPPAATRPISPAAQAAKDRFGIQ